MEFLADPLVRLGLAAVAVALAIGVVFLFRASRRTGGRTIRVVGVGGGGANAVEAMIRARMKGVEYVVVNTDVNALRRSSAGTKIAIGSAVTHGMGTGGDVAAGESAAREAGEEIGGALAGSDMVVITAGLGGGTGSGATPVVAEIARQHGALTVAVVTKPFGFEGARRREAAQDASAALLGLVDAVATIPNDRVRDVMSADVTVEDAFRAIAETLRQSVGEMVELVSVPGQIKLDFADVRAVLQGGGAASIGFGRATGENRAIEATRKAMAATLLETRVEGARSVLVKVTGSRKLRLAELDAVADTVLATAGRGANLVFGTSLQPQLRDEVEVTLIATGFGATPAAGVGVERRIEAAVDAASPDWHPVWLRRSSPAESKARGVATPQPTPLSEPQSEPQAEGEPEQVAEPERKPEPVIRSRRDKRAAQRAAQRSAANVDGAPKEAGDQDASSADAIETRLPDQG